MIKIKHLNVFWLIIAVLFLQPSFACGCGDMPSFTDQLIAWGILGIVIIIYLIPSLYFAKYFKKYHLSFVPIFLSHVLMGVMLYGMTHSFKLGLNPMFYWLAQYIPIILIFAVIGFIGVLIWIYPMLYVAKKAK